MIFWAMAALFVFVTLIFVAIALLFPEWVGITGKVAREFERQQRGDGAVDPEKREDSSARPDEN